MKIIFGKRAYQETAVKRSMVSGRNVKWININNEGNLRKNIYRLLLIGFIISYVAALLLLRIKSTLNVYNTVFIFNVLATPLSLTLHELLHVLPAKIMGFKNITLCFSPHGLVTNTFGMKPSACVICDNVPMFLFQQLFFTLMPFICLALVPAIAAIFLPNARFILIVFAISNALICMLDLTYVTALLIKKPKGKFVVSGEIYTILQSDDSTVAHLDVNSKEELIIREWKISGKKIIEIEPDISGNLAYCVNQIEKERAEGAWWVSKKSD